jgi:putative ABC transport system permease protein
MRPYGYVVLTRARLRAHPWYELLAATGIAIGVALTVAVLLASSSVGRASGEIARGVTGTADLQLRGRASTGFDAGLLREVRAIPGVRHAAGVLEQRAVLVGRNGRQEPVSLIGVDPAIAALKGALTRPVAAQDPTAQRGMALPSVIARALGLPAVRPRRREAPPSVRVEVRGEVASVPVTAVLDADVLGPVTDARVGVMSVERLRAVTRLPGRLTRVLVEATPGRERAVSNELRHLVGARLDVTDTVTDSRLLDEALKPNAQATAFFAIVASLLGFLLAFNAVLLSVAERRRWHAELITVNGASPRAIFLLVVLQSLLLGGVGSVAGVAAGLLLANGLLHESADYLAPAFAVGARTVVSPLPIVVGVATGLLACLLAAVPLLLDLRAGRPLDAVFASDEQPGRALARVTVLRVLAAAAACTAGALAIVAFVPTTALLGCALLALATVLAVPAAFQGVVTAAGILERRTSRRFALLAIALPELRATGLRSLALACTGAIAVFGAVAIGGAYSDLLRGIDQSIDDYVGTADLWIAQAADNQATNSFPIGRAKLGELSAVPGVRAVRAYGGSFLDIGDRRVWVVARDARDTDFVPRSQLRDGDVTTATSRIRSRGRASVSDKLADELGARTGDPVTLPTPTGPRTIRVAATTSNLGWPLGAIVMNVRDYRSWWGTSDPSAIEVRLADGASSEALAADLQRTLGGDSSGLHVQTADERAAGLDATVREGLSRLAQIAMLLLIAACLAMASALAAAIWQRRPRLADRNLLGMLPVEQWRALLIESSLVIGTGCLAGAAFGVLGQVVIDGYLVAVTGFPLDQSLTVGPALTTFLLVVGSALAVVAIPGWIAAHVDAELTYAE